MDNRLLTDKFVRFTDTHQDLHTTSCHLFAQKNPYRTVRFYILAGFVQGINFLIRGVMI